MYTHFFLVVMYTFIDYFIYLSLHLLVIVVVFILSRYVVGIYEQLNKSIQVRKAQNVIM